MSPIPQLDWPKDLYSTPWKDVRVLLPAAPSAPPWVAHWKMWTVSALRALPVVTLTRALFHGAVRPV